MFEWHRRTIELLASIGRAVAAGQDIVQADIDAIADKDSINRQGREFWHDALKGLSDDEVARVAQGLTFVETHLEWIGGSGASTICIFRELVQRNASRDFLDQLSAWILQNTWNDYSPFGTTRYRRARNYSHYLQLHEERMRRNAKSVEIKKKSDSAPKA